MEVKGSDCRVQCFCCLSIYYYEIYLGVVRLLTIKDYWDTQQYMPDHQIAKELGMACDQFIFLWQNFHIYNVEDLDMQAEEEAGTPDEDDKEEGILYDESVKCIQHDQDDSDEEDESEDDEEKETTSLKT
eukprot:7922481-Ditylum_brightwellii.AAC.1